MVVVWFICYLCGTIETYAGCIFSVDKNCSAKAAALCTEEKARLSIFVFYRSVDDNESHGKKPCFLFLKSVHIHRFFFSRGHHESVGDLHPRFTRLTADTSKTSAVTCRGSPSRKTSRFVASQLHLLHLCISAVIFVYFAPVRPLGERRDTRYEKVWSHTVERKKLSWNHFEWKN